MGAFDIFKNKSKQDNFNKENILESALRKAATDPVHRAAFYEKLLSEKLIVLTDDSTLPKGVQVLPESTSVNIAHLPDGKIPVFTSTHRIFDKAVINKEVPILEIKGEDLFNFATGATFVLNPYSEYGKVLLPHEIESLLKGTVLHSTHETITTGQAEQVQIGQPANYPVEIIKSLSILFSGRPRVKAAYLGWIFSPSSGQPPHLIFALDIDGDHQSITDEAGFTAQQLSKPEEIIDFIQIDNQGGISDYFINETKPFYVR